MKRKTFFRLVLLFAIVVVLIAAFVGSSLGKYKTTIELSSNVSFSAKLADELILQEHEAVHKTDGSYELNSNKVVTENSYVLIPGLNVPKDPHVVISGKTDIPAFLYVEVIDALGNDAISYNLAECWQKISDSGKYGGEVYVYAPGGTAAEITSDLTVNILLNDKIVVGQQLKLNSSASDVLNFYACLHESAGSTAETVYNQNHKTN